MKPTNNFLIKGFSLIELLTVIAIITILTTLVMVSTRSAQAKSRDTQRKSDLQEVAAALETYKAVNHQYPSLIDFVGSWQQLKPYLFPEFIDKWPEDPRKQSASAGFGEGYVYASNLETLAPLGTYYVLDANLEIKESPTNSDITNFQLDNSSLKFFLSGTFISQGYGEKTHYRLSGR